MALLGFSAVGTTYYDVQVKQRQRLLPFIIWVNQHRKDLLASVVSIPERFELGGRTFHNAADVTFDICPSDSCFILNLDDDSWSETGTMPSYIDWGEVWLYSKHRPPRHAILWDLLPGWDAYRAGVYLEQKIELGYAWGYDYHVDDLVHGSRLKSLALSC